MTVYYGPVAYIQLKRKNDEDVHVLYFCVPTNFLKKQFFVAGDVLCQLPNTGAGTWLNASIRNLGKYPKTAAGMSFKKKKQLFSIWTSSNIVGKTSFFLEIQWRDFRLQNIV